MLTRYHSATIGSRISVSLYANNASFTITGVNALQRSTECGTVGAIVILKALHSKANIEQ